MLGKCDGELKLFNRGKAILTSSSLLSEKSGLESWTPPHILSLSSHWKWSESLSVVSDSLRLHGLYSSWNSPGQNTGEGSLSLPQGIFPTQESNPGLPYCRQILYQLSHQGSPRILEWVASPFSCGSSRPRNWTRVSCIAGGFWEGDTLQNLLTKGDFPYKYSLQKATPAWFSGPFPCLLLFRK